jgi:MFS transporter, DHA2 family, multidrug resistance protein
MIFSPSHSRNHKDQKRRSEDVPLAAADAARDTLGGALAVAQELPGRRGQGLVDAAQSAFTKGLQLSAGIGAVVAIGIAAEA